MIDMKCPIAGTLLHVADDQAEKFQKAGYKPVRAARKKRAKAEHEDEAVEQAEHEE